MHFSLYFQGFSVSPYPFLCPFCVSIIFFSINLVSAIHHYSFRCAHPFGAFGI
nr:MAG TPA: hypothetical protein [Caudoviricetes sp.]